ncbi:ATP-grasp domain-containing protein [Bacillus sp. S70]|uniref:ATP-grasp domain-containing protein n=1 Tax=Bacillus TaxID=1386 RepID=UPI00190B9EB4|nr:MULTISPECIES: ATP-grasp domain-containing protein [Bacillus]MBJ9983306.1 ATP-grasp domain-containing protein [Bacillus sp. S29]MBK0103821.1 ATP-grasp domain-containing protein [Bacillus sp. S70]MBK0109395.1 ATP-grasp domain-containing protein [Bacillus sp. S73]MBK0138190.1 ATP-grasp domain-containing protein [Bacillus sp. S72]MBK0148759.1 ATP-grasp domain-containing protein [Bacillus sp. S74]
MSILVMTRYDSNRANIEEWVKDYKEPVVLITNKDVSDSHSNLTEKVVFDQYIDDYSVEVRVRELHEKYKFKRLIVFEEFDIERAGIIRQTLKIPGQFINSANAFRDKVIMKSFVQEAGIKVPNFKSISNSFDLLEFTNEFGFPIFLKPKKGMASIGTSKIGNEVELVNWLKKNKPVDFMVETYIEGDVYHTDGLVKNGKIIFFSAFSYVNTIFSSHSLDGLGDKLITEDNMLLERFKNYTEHVLCALPCPDVFTFHLEFFLTKDDEILFCEIASRTSGFLVPNIIKKAYNVSLDQELLVNQLNDDNKEIQETKPTKYYLAFYRPLKKGKLVKKINSLPFPCIEEYEIKGEEDKIYNPTAYFETYVRFIISAKSEKELDQQLQLVNEYIDENTIWEESEII